MTKYLGVATDDQQMSSLNLQGAGSTNITALYHKSFAVNGAAAVAADSTAQQTFSVPGVQVGDAVFVNKPTLQAGLGIAGACVSSANTVAITYVNATAAAISPNNETYQLFGVR
jgi:hypothetical protein